jgi:DNA mismatch endonuclease (patch repair protein)
MKPYRPKPAAEITRNMRAIRSTDNRTEAALRSALHSMGLRYRKYSANLPGRPDIVFVRAKVVVFVDGDYWHARLLRERGRRDFQRSIRTKSREYWIKKFDYRIQRDDFVTRSLQEQGWEVIRLWESDVKKNVEKAALRVAALVKRRTG